MQISLENILQLPLETPTLTKLDGFQNALEISIKMYENKLSAIEELEKEKIFENFEKQNDYANDYLTIQVDRKILDITRKITNFMKKGLETLVSKNQSVLDQISIDIENIYNEYFTGERNCLDDQIKKKVEYLKK